ncbi:MAG: peptidoglycan binding protein CsiV [Gammaproteobacteria bacterium]|nr:peptidoglycan binding protein CsiV [Gammaproteobacteria bacterium]
MKILATLLLIFITVGQPYAETKDSAAEDLKDYDIEIIIFEDAHARYIDSEIWPQTVADGTEALENLNQVKPGKADKKSFKNIKPVILSNEYKRINNSSEYNILFYGGWRQPGLEKDNAFDIDISELNNVHKNRSGNSITGHFKVVLARYLHFYSELEYHRKADQQHNDIASTDRPSAIGTENIATDVNKTDSLTGNYDIYPMINHSRMRSNELHYIDHPLVGMLVQINKVEKPDTGH